MPPVLQRLLPSGGLGTLAALFCAGSGLSSVSRWRRPSDACVLTFHGLLDDREADQGIIDEATHTKLSLFEELCDHLKRHYHVISTSSLIQARMNGAKLPENAVVITFDDGYASNYELAWPVLRHLGLPATIYLVSGYLDRVLLPWFVRLELALKRTSESAVLGLSLSTEADKRMTYGVLCRQLKDTPWDESMTLLDTIEARVGVRLQPGDTLPPALRPMSWDMAREMQVSGLIELGGHTHTHPVLGRCTQAQAELEIQTCAARLTAELGPALRNFAYPNGRPEDFGPAVMKTLRSAGFTGAFTMVDSFISPRADLFALPRYGSPESRWKMEAMISGVAQRLRQIRRAVRPQHHQQEVRA